jgi:hypothetical protein
MYLDIRQETEYKEQSISNTLLVLVAVWQVSYHLPSSTAPAGS